MPSGPCMLRLRPRLTGKNFYPPSVIFRRGNPVVKPERAGSSDVGSPVRSLYAQAPSGTARQKRFIRPQQSSGTAT
ncbi:hypothetical protein GCM10009414_23790 [Tatumella terrea]